MAVAEFAQVGFLVALLAGCTNYVEPVALPERSMSGGLSARQPAGPEIANCRSRDLDLAVAGSGAVMSQPFIDISLQNSAETACRLRGYPDIEVLAWSPPGERSSLPTVVRQGSIYARSNGGPNQVILAANGVASFSVGTSTARGKRLLTLTRLAITPPGNAQPIRLPVRLPVTRAAGRPLFIGVTAVQAGGSGRWLPHRPR